MVFPLLAYLFKISYIIYFRSYIFGVEPSQVKEDMNKKYSAHFKLAK